MSTTTAIEWADSTFNPWIGCTKVSPACDHCYAAVSHPSRALGVTWGAGQPRRRTSPSNWKQPVRWNAKPFYECYGCSWRGDKPSHPADGGLWVCPTCGSDAIVVARRRVFCASLADVFDNEVDPQWRYDLLELIKATPNLDWLLLTKRIGNVTRMLEEAAHRARDRGDHDMLVWLMAWVCEEAPKHVWLGATIANQQEADRDLKKLMATRAAIRFVSIEPLLGAIDLTYPETVFPNGPGMCCNGQECGCMGQPIDPPMLYGVDWVIVGGESGPGARPMHPAWVRSLRDQCTEYRVPFLFKQWGDWEPREEWSNLHLRTSPRQFERMMAVMPDGSPCSDDDVPQDVGAHRMACVGKHVAGRSLDGVHHNGYPRSPACAR